MIIIPGWIVSIATFSGVIVHEISHKLFYDLSGVPVYEVAYFKLRGKSSGHVIHAPAKNIKSAFLISMGPLILNSILCVSQ